MLRRTGSRSRNLTMDFDRHERQMRLFGRIFAVMFVLVFTIIVSLFIVQGYLAYKVITDPSSVGNYMGEVVNGITNTVGKNNEPNN
jgi:hypothetical protein